MTPTELETYIRQRYNAVGDTFFSQTEIFNYLWAAQIEMARETFCIKNTYTTVSVADQRAYDLPDNTISVRRIEYNGERLYPNDFIDDDALTGNNTDADVSGKPVHYQRWGDQVYLRPRPSTAGLTIKIFSYDQPSQPSAAGTLDLPKIYHLDLADYALYCMFAKEKNYQMATQHFQVWGDKKKQAILAERSKQVGDEFRIVKDGEEIWDDTRLRW